MPTDVVMPQMGESIFEGTIIKWLKKVGDAVEKDEPLFEISTDKVDAEIPSPVTGVLTEIKTQEGATVQVNTVVAVIGGSGSGAGDAGTSGAGDTASGGRTSAEPAAPSRLASQQAAAPTPRVEPAKPSAAPQVLPGQPVRSSPLVRRIAREHDINLAHVAGTGAGGRISKDDILRHIASPPAAAESGARESGRAAAPQVAQMLPQVPASEIVPLSRMRAIIAQRMVESKQISPHVHTVYKVDMTRIVQLREQERSGFEKRNGVKLTYMPFIAMAVVGAMRKHPIVNASLVENAIHYHAHINLGIAVALEWGLIVPVVRQAEERSFVELARTINDLALRARTKKLTPDEVGGSTFTLTNSGVFGDEFSTPIINQPESAILCISGLNKEPVVVTDDKGNDTIAIRSMQHFTLGFDHRLIDGADACRFMMELKRALEGWELEIG